MGGGNTPDLGPQQLADAQLESDREQQEGDAQVGHLVEECTALRAERAEDETGNEKTDERWQADLGGQEAEGEGDCYPDRITVVDG